MIEVLRDYLAARYAQAALSLTTHRAVSAPCASCRTCPDDRLTRAADRGRPDQVRAAPGERRPRARDRTRGARDRRRRAHRRRSRRRDAGRRPHDRRSAPMQFASAWVLLLLLLLPIWWIDSPPAHAGGDRLLARRRAGRRSARRAARRRCMLFTLPQPAARVDDRRAVAAARPARTRRTSTSEGINIVLAIDLSSSMLAQDFQPQNRLEVAKDVVKRFIAARTSDRIGVVAFAAEALTQVPLTTDYPVVNAAVDNLAAGPARGRHGDRHRDRDGGEPAARRARPVARDDPAHRRREQSRRDRSAHGGEGGGGVRHQDLHDRRRHRRHGAGAGRSRAVRTSLRESAGADRRAAAHRHREDDGRPLLPRARRRGARSASTRRSTSSSASRCGRARTCATPSCFAGRSTSRR